MDVSVTIVDTTFGRPAEDVEVTLLREIDTIWHQEAGVHTDQSGRAVIPRGGPARGRYRLVIDLDPYFAGLGATSLQPRIDITFRAFGHDRSIPFTVSITPSSFSVLRMPAHD